MFSPIKGHPAACKQQFEDKDPRSKVALSELDPRIHFALNCLILVRWHAPKSPNEAFS